MSHVLIWNSKETHVCAPAYSFFLAHEQFGEPTGRSGALMDAAKTIITRQCGSPLLL